MNFDELDDLFKQGLGNREIPFDPTSWAKMNAALNQTNPTVWAKAIKIFAGIKTTTVAASITAGIVASSITFYTITSSNNTPISANEEVAINNVIEVAESQLQPIQALTTIEVVNFNQEEGSKAAESTPTPKAVLLAQLEPNTNSTPTASIENQEDYYFEDFADTENESSALELMNKMMVLGLKQNTTSPVLANGDQRSKHRLEKNRKRLTSFGLIAGLNVSQGLLNTGTSRSRPDQNIVVGLQATRALNKKTNATIELLYQQREGLNSSKTYTNTTYSFGKTVESTQIEAISLHSIEMPISVSYKISKLHTVYGGGYFAYVLNAKSAVKTSSSLPDVTPSATESWGYNRGFSTTDFGIVAGYAFNIYPKLRLGIRMNYGFKDLTQNSYYNNNSFDNNFQARFVLDYKLSKI